MNIVVLGHLVLDEIHTFQGTIIESLGGIYFPLGAFDAIAKKDDMITPVFSIGNDATTVFSEVGSKLKHTDLQYCYHVPESNTRVRLFHDEQAQYNTQLVESLPSIPLKRCETACKGANLIYVNMMTGDDIIASDFANLRRSSPALVFLDIHMIAYKVGRSGYRAPAEVDHWLPWISGADIVQCNEKELSTFLPLVNTASEKVETFFNYSPLQICIVTKGDRGADIYTADGNRISIPASKNVTVVDSTGCGDVFGSTFAYYYVKGFASREAGAIASKAASFVLSLSGAHGLQRLGEFLDRITA